MGHLSTLSNQSIWCQVISKLQKAPSRLRQHYLQLFYGSITGLILTPSSVECLTLTLLQKYCRLTDDTERTLGRVIQGDYRKGGRNTGEMKVGRKEQHVRKVNLKLINNVTRLLST